MEEYITWKDPQGRAFDPWLRVHTRLGGRIVRVSHEAMRITASLAEWHQWTGIQFRENGPCTVPGGLCPLNVDLQSEMAEYVEPNVWMVHSLLPVREGRRCLRECDIGPAETSRLRHDMSLEPSP